MKRIPDLRETPDLPPEIKEAALNGQLVLFVGAGASTLVGLPSWAGLAWNALSELRDNGLLNYSELDQLKDLDPKKQLSIAKLMAEENKHELNLTKYLKPSGMNSRIYEYLNNIGCVCVTTNYDELLEPKFYGTHDSSKSYLPINRIYEREKFFGSYLNEPGSVIHLHGAITDPRSMVVTTKDYLEHYDHEQVQEFLGEVFDKKIVMFIGYGLEEAEVLEHILRRGSARTGVERRRFALQGFFISQKPLYEKLYEYYEKSFGVYLMGFVRDHRDYSQLEEIVKSWVQEIEVKKPALAEDLGFMREVLGNE